MANRNHYQSLVEDYKGIVDFAKKLGWNGLMLQFGILGVANSWKHLGFGWYEIAAPILFCSSIYFIVKDFLTFRKVDDVVTKKILAGVELEKNSPIPSRFFLDILQNFNLVKLLIQRFLVNALAFWSLGYLISQFLKEVKPQYVMSQEVLIFIAGILAAIMSKFYYHSYVPLARVKEQVVTEQH